MFNRFKNTITLEKYHKNVFNDYEHYFHYNRQDYKPLVNYKLVTKIYPKLNGHNFNNTVIDVQNKMCILKNSYVVIRYYHSTVMPIIKNTFSVTGFHIYQLTTYSHLSNIPSEIEP